MEGEGVSHTPQIGRSDLEDSSLVAPLGGQPGRWGGVRQPGVGDPLCAVAGWQRLPFWPCLLYMGIGKFLRYLLMTAALLWVFPSAALS